MTGFNAHGNSRTWTTAGPTEWPDAPAEMTVTTVGEIESCPRRWALGAARYPDLWSGRGYPPRVQVRALSGTIVHLSLELITRALVRAGCPPLQDPAAIRVMKDLGGYTRIVNECINQILKRLANNPRAQGVMEFAAQSLRGQVPELRGRVQTMLCRMRLPRLEVRQNEGGASKVRGPLTIGAYPEIELRAERIGWKGKADLLLLSPDACEITDFKTGAPRDEHEFQMHVYALLWSRDADLNPDGRPVDRLILAYPSGDVEAAVPTQSDLDELELLLINRREAALHAVSEHPPEARPDAQQCRYCAVRQLCGEYWIAETQSRMVSEVEDGRFGDIEVTITGRHGPSSWDAIVDVSRHLERGKVAVIRASDDRKLPADQRARILDVAVTVDDEDHAQPAVITLGAVSEVYTVSSG
jgi:hypothetical protein